MKDSGDALKEIVQSHLTVIAENMIDQIRRKFQAAIPSDRINAINGIEPVGVNAYKDEILTAFSIISFDAIEEARKEVPKKKNVKLCDAKVSTFKLSEFDKLPPDIQKKIKQQAKLLVGTHIADLEKNIFFQFNSSWDATDSMDELMDDLFDSADDYIRGVAVTSGSATLASKLVNDARSAFFLDDDVLSEVEGFVFRNDDPVSEVCENLELHFGPDSGNIIAKDDPDLFKYTPPLHFNCKSSLEPVLLGDSGGRETKKFRPTTSEIENKIQFSEHHACCGHKKENGSS